MKHATKISLALALIIVGALFVWKGPFLYKNFRGAAPAFIPDEPRVEDQNPDNNLGLQVPDGFRIGIFAKDLGGPRVIIRDGFGNLLVSIPKDGVVLALTDTNNDGVEDKRYNVVQGLNKPHGIAVRCDDEQVGKTRECKLYVAEENKVVSYIYNAQTMRADRADVLTQLPSGGRHTTRTLAWDSTNQNRLLVSIGSSCDVCRESDERRAAVWSLDVNSKEFKLYAKGLRNAVFMATHPVTGKVWVTEMGRDFLGDDLPPDELNILAEGENYGWPICYGKNIHDTRFDKNTYIKNPCEAPQQTPSYVDLPAHSAPLGIAFVPEEGQWPSEYWHNALVAYHGSWNRSAPTGYKVVRIKLDATGKYLGTEDFITGWLKGTKAHGRPAGILLTQNGTGFISDDSAGVIYILIYTPPEKNQTGGIRDLNIQSGSTIVSPLIVTGEAPGNWFFEASLPVIIQDADGKEIARGSAQARGDWMTTNYVPFTSTLNFAKPKTSTGFLIIKNSNPSGLRENEKIVKIPITF